MKRVWNEGKIYGRNNYRCGIWIRDFGHSERSDEGQKGRVKVDEDIITSWCSYDEGQNRDVSPIGSLERF